LTVDLLGGVVARGVVHGVATLRPPHALHL
jgi:hypothetical protein